MRNLIRISLTLPAVLILTLFYSHLSFAQCSVTGATPGGGEVVNCTGTDPNGITTTNNPDEVTVQEGADLSRTGDHVIETLDGDDFVRVNGGMIEGLGPSDDCVDLGEGNNEFHMTAGTLITNEDGVSASGLGANKFTVEGGTIDASGGGDEAINGGDGPDEIYVMGGLLIGDDAAIEGHLGDDKIIITGGRLEQDDTSDSVVDGSSGNDHIFVSNAVLDGTLAFNNQAIDGGEDNDTVKLGTGAQLLGKSDGGDGFDTLVFEMTVPQEFIDEICSRILSQDPAQDAVVVNGLLYEWIEFEVILCELVPGIPGRITPIPTLSEWGLIAMAGILGIVGLLVMKRRKKAEA